MLIDSLCISVSVHVCVYLLTNNVFHESLVLRIVEVSIIVILIVLCVIGNCLLFYIIVTTSPRWWTTPANFFNVNLAFTDLMVGIVVLPFMAMSISWQSWLLSDFLCQSTAFAMILLMASSTLTLSVISLDRYFCICLPLHYQSVVTTERVASVVTVLWLTSFLLASIPLFGWGRYTFRPQSIPICSVLLEGQQRHVILLWSFMILLPITVMIYSYVQILKVARKQANQIGCVENHFNSSMMTGTNETIGTSQNGTISFGNNDSKHFVSRSLKSLKIVSIIIGE
uniref:G-protein coupled receptors family 1 profile domain-containing protein n=1 Tax=Octopus bimaculoides TaxID=37653 RepID=A0A0L8H0I4_OCTBM